MQLLAKAGVAIPKTVFSRNTADIDDLIEMVGGTPVIIKLARGTHGNGVVLADNKRMAKSALQAAKRSFCWIAWIMTNRPPVAQLAITIPTPAPNTIR